jgi:hypothetical protein
MFEFCRFHGVFLSFYHLDDSLVVLLVAPLAHLICRRISDVLGFVLARLFHVFGLCRSDFAHGDFVEGSTSPFGGGLDLFFARTVEGDLADIGTLTEGDQILEGSVNNAARVVALSGNVVVLYVSVRIDLKLQCI